MLALGLCIFAALCLLFSSSASGKSNTDQSPSFDEECEKARQEIEEEGYDEWDEMEAELEEEE